MIKKLLYFEWIRRRKKYESLMKSAVKMAGTYALIPTIIFVCFLNTCIVVNNNTYWAVVVSFSATITVVLQAVLRTSIRDIPKDPVLVFIKKERYAFIKSKVNLIIYKTLLMFIIPITAPIIICSKNRIADIGIGLMTTAGFYLLNAALAYLISYLEVEAARSLFYKFVYILGIIGFLVLLFMLKTYITGEIISGFLGKGENTFNIYSERSILLITIGVTIALVLYLLALRLVKNKPYIVLNPIQSGGKRKSNLSNGILKIKGTDFYKKIFFKDLCCFIRKKGMEFHTVLWSQVGLFIFFCFTILQDRPKGIVEEFYTVSGFYIVCGFASIFMILMAMYANIKEIKISEEFGVIKRFGIKADWLKILRVKANFIFMISSVVIVLTGLTNFLLNISLSSIAQTLLILMCILSWIRYSSLMITDIVNFGFNQIRVMVFLVIAAAGFKIMIWIFIHDSYTGVFDLAIKYLLMILINFLGYYVELMLLSYLERDGVND